MLGNSHTHSNNLPQMVSKLLTTDKQRVVVETRFAPFVEELASSTTVRRELSSGQWQVVVLQGAKLSSSHKYKYSHDGAVQLAKLAKNAGSRVLLFAEWPRKGWSETSYILKEYGEISQASGAELVHVPEVWDGVLAKLPKLDPWAADGNHAQLTGSYLAAVCLTTAIARRDLAPAWRPPAVDEATAALIVKTANGVLLNRKR
jgi:hypothetical protein